MRQLTIEYIRGQFEKEGYELLTKVYKNNRQKLDYICPKGHKHSITWAKWQQKKRCPYCAGNVKLTIEFIRLEFAKENYKLLTTEYINCEQKLDYICSNSHKHSISWSNWRRGKRCPYCSGYFRKTIKFIKFEFAKEGYKLLTKEYVNSKQKLDYICKNGHKHSTSWGNWQAGYRCPYCVGLVKPTIEFIRAKFEKEGHLLLSDKYINSHEKLDYICSKGHEHSIRWDHFRDGHGCPHCVGLISKGEIEVRNFVESLGIKILVNDRNQIVNPETGNGFELDIFMSDLSKAIEYNGEYWHKDKTRDLLKYQLCKSKGIELLTVWDRKWKVNNKECKEIIMSFIFNNNTSFIVGAKNFE